MFGGGGREKEYRLRSWSGEPWLWRTCLRSGIPHAGRHAQRGSARRSAVVVPSDQDLRLLEQADAIVLGSRAGAPSWSSNWGIGSNP